MILSIKIALMMIESNQTSYFISVLRVKISSILSIFLIDLSNVCIFSSFIFIFIEGKFRRFGLSNYASWEVVSTNQFLYGFISQI